MKRGSKQDVIVAALQRLRAYQKKNAKCRERTGLRYEVALRQCYVAEHLTMIQSADRLGVHPHTIRKDLLAMGISTRSVQGQGRGRKKDPYALSKQEFFVKCVQCGEVKIVPYPTLRPKVHKGTLHRCRSCERQDPLRNADMQLTAYREKNARCKARTGMSYLEAIKALYAQSRSLQEVGDRVGMSPQAVRRDLQSIGIKLQTRAEHNRKMWRGYRQQQMQQAKDAHAEQITGMPFSTAVTTLYRRYANEPYTVDRVASRLGVSKWAVYTELKRQQQA